MLVFDLETDGFLENVTRVHCLAIHDTTTKQTAVFSNNHEGDRIAEGLAALSSHVESGGLVAGHNVVSYDLPVLNKLYGWSVPLESVRDTLLLAQMAFSDIRESDFARHKAGKLPGNLIGLHRLDAWGHRLNLHKGDYRGDPSIADEKERYRRRWESWNKAMSDYCALDVQVTARLLEVIQSHMPPIGAVQMENRFAEILHIAQQSGFPFNESAAASLYAQLATEREAVRVALVAQFGTWRAAKKPFVPKRDNAKLGYKKGVPVERFEDVTFNPGSRHHIAKVLVDLGWKPAEYGANGQPTVNDEILADLPYPEAKSIAKYLLLEKRIGQLAEGVGAWLKTVKDGRLHPRIISLGTVTGRCSHRGIGQVPRVGTAYGADFRALFGPPKDWFQVGCDMSGLELRCLGHYLGAYDGGAYGDVVVNGDVHTLNCEAIGFDPKKLYTINGKQVTGRNLAKTWVSTGPRIGNGAYIKPFEFGKTLGKSIPS